MTDNRTMSLKLDSIAEFAHHVKDSAPDGVDQSGESWQTARAGMSPRKAQQCGENGGYWPEGAKNIQPLDLPLDDLLAHDLTLPRMELSVQGSRAIVPAYLANSPYAMMKQTPFSTPNRVIKMAAHVGKSYGTSQEATFNRGNAILSVIDALSAGGFNVELWACWRNDTGGYHFNIDTLIKASDAAYSPDSIAFALCNDAFQRRFNWRVIANVRLTENHPDQHTAQYSDQNGFGNGRNAKFKDFDMSYGYLVGDGGYENPKEALKTVVKATRKQLKRMQNPAATVAA